MPYLVRANVAVPITSANQAVYQDGSSNDRPGSYNESHSGGSKKVSFSTAATALVSSTPCRLCKIHIPGTGGTPGNITVYDNGAGVATGTVLYGPTTPTAGQIIDLQIPCDNGITIVTASAMVGFVTYDPN
jgi:hypothetical protein